MSDCGVCIGGGDYDGAPEFENVTEPKVRKQYRCWDCRRPILPGQIYQRRSGKFEGRLYSERRCLECVEIYNALACDGGALEDGLWNDIEQYVFPQMTTGCVAKLSTVSAKKFLLEKWMKWKGLAA